MTNAELFKKIFGIYSEEYWSYTEKQMLEWINADVLNTNIGDTISRQAAIDAIEKYFAGLPVAGEALYMDLKGVISTLPSALVRIR